MKRILLLRSGAVEDGGEDLPADVDLLLTHEVVPLPAGIEEALALDPAGTALVVTSRSSVKVLSGVRDDFFERPFSSVVAAGEGTARALREAGSAGVVVPRVPGAAGIVEFLSTSPSPRTLWPHGSDADTAPFEGLAGRGGVLSAPVVYEKRPVARLDRGCLEALFAGTYAGVAVSSISALDVLLAAVRADGRTLPQVRWGAIGPGTARAFAERNLPVPVVPSRARLADLIDALKEEKK